MSNDALSETTDHKFERSFAFFRIRRWQDIKGLEYNGESPN